jgi:hypothetical protein
MICIHMTREQLVHCWVNSTKKWFDGNSNVREGADRDDRLVEDQLVGQIGEAAGILWWYGSIEPYLKSREIANATPWKGDGGTDVRGLHLDFKASMMRGPQDPSFYYLPVRPRERHKGCVYVRVLMPKFKLEDLSNGLNVYIAGWAKESDLPDKMEEDGIFDGAYLLESSKLRPVGAAYAQEIVESQFFPPEEPPLVHDF